MSPVKALSFLALLLATGAAHAAPVELTRQQSSDLYVVLTRLEAGLAPANAITAADNLNTLRPAVEALDKGKLAAQRQLRALLTDEARETKSQLVLDSLETKAAEVLTLDLAALDLTPEEITAAKIVPRDLATLRQFLRPAKK